MAAALLGDAVRRTPDTTTGTVTVASAGVAAHAGDAATDLAIRVMKRHGINLDHRATRLTRDIAEHADVILTMTTDHNAEVLRRAPTAARKLFTICEYAGLEGHVSDPLAEGTEEAYERCAPQLVALTPRIFERLRSPSNRT